MSEYISEQNQISVLDRVMNGQVCQGFGLCLCSWGCIQDPPIIQHSTVKKIISMDSQNSSDSQVNHTQQVDSSTAQPVSKLKKIKKVAYFTKNFLPSFKIPHLNFLKKRLGNSFVNKFSLVKQLEKKNGITLKDYEELYKIEEFRPALKEMLDQKALFRDLILARSKPGYKITHDQILFNFDQVWHSRTFKKIALRKEISVPETWVR